MKSLIPIFLICFFTLTSSLQAQEEYTVDGQTYQLKTEVKGELDLLWNVIDNRYRYFLKKGEYITELTNTKVNGKYQQEYKEVLKTQTDNLVSTKRVILTLTSLHSFFAEYNAKKDSDFIDETRDNELQVWLGVYGGITNSAYIENISHDNQAVGGLSIELTDNDKLRRHGFVFDFRHTFESKDSKYSASQLSINYRFKFIKSKIFDMYVNTKFASLSFFKKEYSVTDAANLTTVKKESGTGFSSPLTFGVGADLKVGKGSITFGYHDIVGLNVEKNKKTPIDFSLGYRINL